MRTAGYAGKADCSRESVNRPRDPSVGVVPRRNHRGYGKGASSMPGWKTAAFEGRFAARKKSVIKGSAGGDIRGTLSACNSFDREIYHRAVGISFSSKQCRAHLVRVVPDIARDHQGRWQEYHLRTCNRGVEGVVHVIEILRMRTEIRHRVGISDDQPGGSAHYGQCREPIVPLRQLSGERQPNTLLIVNKIPRQAAPRDFPV